LNRAVWRTLPPWLVDLVVLADVNLPAFGIFCSLYGRWKTAQGRLDGEGMGVEDPVSGVLKPSPYLKIADEGLKQLKGYLAEFGLTPASRPRIHAAQPVERDADAELGRRYFGS
jgi:P27 family predicted phage terminase small subunit